METKLILENWEMIWKRWCYYEDFRYSSPAKPAKSCQDLKTEKSQKNTPPEMGTAKQTVKFWRPQHWNEDGVYDGVIASLNKP